MVLLCHFSGRLVCNRNGQHRLGDGLGGGLFLPIVVGRSNLHLVGFRVSRVVHIVHLPQDVFPDVVILPMSEKIAKKTAQMQKNGMNAKSAMPYIVYPKISFISLATNFTCSLVGSVLFSSRSWLFCCRK